MSSHESPKRATRSFRPGRGETDPTARGKEMYWAARAAVLAPVTTAVNSEALPVLVRVQDHAQSRKNLNTEMDLDREGSPEAPDRDTGRGDSPTNTWEG